MGPAEAALSAYRLQCVRVGVITTALTLAVLTGYEFLPGNTVENRTPYLAVILGGALGMIVVARLPWDRLLEGPAGIRMLYAWSVLDIVLISVGAVLAGGGRTEWVLVYALTTVFFAASYPLVGQAALLAFTVVSYLAAAAVGDWSLSVAAVFFRLSFLFVIAFLASFLSKRLMDEMAQHAAALQDSNDRAAMLALVADAARVMSTTEPEELLRTVADYATRVGFDGAEICMFDEPAGVWVQQYHHGPDIPGYQPWGAIDSGLAGAVRRERETMVIEDYAEWEPGVPSVRDAGFRTSLGCPIWSGDELTGVLIAGAFKARPIEPHVMEAVELLASQAGAALVVTRRYAERVAHEVMLRHQANHDPLTGLPNRSVLFDRLGHALQAAARDGRKVSVMFIDLDRFKAVNDSLGHEIGDVLLRRVADRLQACVRPSDTLARYGGDEFALLLDGVTREECTRVAARVIAAMDEPVDLGGRLLPVSCSVGITRVTAGASTTEVLREADVAMFRAKETGGGGWLFFEPEMDTETRDRLDREAELRDAIAAQQFVLHYQPIVSLDTGRIDEVEALVRWNHPDRGLVYPDSFISLAERTGLIVPLGRWVLEEACRQARRWADVGIDLGVSVNLSVAQFQERGLVDDIACAIAEAGIPATRLTLEVTESVMIDHQETAIATMEAIDTLGVSIALDDFGQGYAFLGHLKRFPTSVVKIDRAFVSGLTTSVEDQAIVRAVVGLSHDLGKRVVAEGVETPEHFHEVRRLGCDRIQGYLVSKPVPSAQITQLLMAPMSVELPSRAEQPGHDLRHRTD